MLYLRLKVLYICCKQRLIYVVSIFNFRKCGVCVRMRARACVCVCGDI